jgi:ribose transport system substrate-binding protein
MLLTPEISVLLLISQGQLVEMLRDKVVLFLSGDDDGYQHAQAIEAQTAAQSVGLELTTIFAHWDVPQQVRQILDFLRHPDLPRIEAFVIEPVREGVLGQLTERVVSSGIGMLLLNRVFENIEDFRRRFSQLPLSVVTDDQAEIGRIQGRQLLALFPEGVPVLYIKGPLTSSSSKRRGEGLHEILDRRGFAITQLYGDWSETSGEQLLDGWMRSARAGVRNLTVIAAQNDSMALGARRALHAISREFNKPELLSIPFLGIDGVQEIGVKAVRSGELAATIVRPPTAGEAVRLVSRHLHGSAIPPIIQFAALSLPPLEDL